MIPTHYPVSVLRPLALEALKTGNVVTGEVVPYQSTQPIRVSAVPDVILLEYIANGHTIRAATRLVIDGRVVAFYIDDRPLTTGDIT